MMMNLNSAKWSFLNLKPAPPPAPPPSSSTSADSQAHGQANPGPGCCACILTAYSNVQADYRAAVGRGDVCVDRFLLCMRAPSEHGSHCMCGCRRLVPDEVYYWPWIKGEDEPITWSSSCPCYD